MKERKFAVRFGASQIPMAEGHCLLSPVGRRGQDPCGASCRPRAPLPSGVPTAPLLRSPSWRRSSWPLLTPAGLTHGTSLGEKGRPRTPATLDIPPFLEGRAHSITPVPLLLTPDSPPGPSPPCPKFQTLPWVSRLPRAGWRLLTPLSSGLGPLPSPGEPRPFLPGALCCSSRPLSCFCSQPGCHSATRSSQTRVSDVLRGPCGQRLDTPPVSFLHDHWLASLCLCVCSLLSDPREAWVLAGTGSSFWEWVPGTWHKCSGWTRE